MIVDGKINIWVTNISKDSTGDCCYASGYAFPLFPTSAVNYYVFAYAMHIAIGICMSVNHLNLLKTQNCSHSTIQDVCELIHITEE